MTRLVPTLAISLILAVTLQAQDRLVLPLWPAGAPGALGERDQDTPTLTVYLPEKEKATGAALVICRSTCMSIRKGTTASASPPRRPSKTRTRGPKTLSSGSKRRDSSADLPDAPDNRPMEICSTLQEGSWGYNKLKRHLTTDEARAKPAAARSASANLLLNPGPLPDGSIHGEDVQTLRETGRRIRAQGWPTAASEPKPDRRKPGPRLHHFEKESSNLSVVIEPGMT